MFFYEVSILDSLIFLLTYHSDKKIEIGSVVKVPLKNKIKDSIVISEVTKPTFDTKEIVEVLDLYLPIKYIDIAKFISHYYFSHLYQAISLFHFFDKSQTFCDTQLELNVKLSERQIEAFNFIQNRKLSLLFGDTGSGKTEIYIKLIENIINSGSSAILLMPEIGLTPQMESRMREHFGDLVAIWHSKITKQSKNKILDTIKKGDIKVVVGARSALFLPLLNLGLIIVDEEHDDSYKSTQEPKINARDLAVYFGKILNIRVVLGSATPNVTSYYKFDTFRLKGRYFESRKLVYFEDSKLELSDKVISKIEQNLNNSKQVIIFLPTRANFKYLFCDSCNTLIECPHCSIGLSVHLNKLALICHYCGYTTKFFENCPTCNSELKSNRIGTSEVLARLQERFLDKVIKKFDRDEIKSDRALRKILSDFNSQKIDILVGTQMLSKGHDYHNIGLAVVLGIDSLLDISDFRASEKTLSLVIQIAGRSGRKEDGEVLIQTKNIDFFREYLGDYEKFIKDNLKLRENLYPPFRKLARVLFSHTNKKTAFESMLKMVTNLKKFDKLDIVGYKEAEVEKIANKYRYNILLRCENIGYLINAILKSKTEFCEIDIDPIHFS